MRLPGVRHKVIGLVSGGKDSCFNLMHSIANGHEIVALANLKPEAGVGEFTHQFTHRDPPLKMPR
jgi:diphthine-ammonia ligase